MKRALRRHHKFRVRRKAKRVMQMLLDDHYSDEIAIKVAEHLAACSCWMCGNPRKWGERTRKEIITPGPNDQTD